MTDANKWKQADRISDVIVDTVNKELDAMRAAGKVEPTQVLAGQLLALLGFIKGAPRPLPETLGLVEMAVHACLEEILGL